MKKCKNCGKVLDDDMAVCDACGSQDFDMKGDKLQADDGESSQANGELASKTVDDENAKTQPNESEEIVEAKEFSETESYTSSSKLDIFVHNLKQILELPKTLAVLGVVFAVCALGLVYFAIQVMAFRSLDDVVGSVFLIDMVFLVLTLLSLILLVASIILNIKRVNSNRKNKK